jgi:hypothetical protein
VEKDNNKIKKILREFIEFEFDGKRLLCFANAKGTDMLPSKETRTTDLS